MNFDLLYFLLQIGCVLMFFILLFVLSWRGWFPKFFPKIIQRLIANLNPKPLIFDESGHLIECCSSPVLHNIQGSRCVWCNKSVTELTKIMDDQVGGSTSLNPLNSKGIPQPDFNSPTSATVNVPFSSDLPEFPEISKSDLNPQSMDLVKTQSYCLHCKSHVEVLDPEYYDQESRRGIRRYLKGSCSVCGSKINAIVKRGG